MKNLLKTFVLLIVLLIALFINPNFINAATTVGSEQDLRDAITNAQNGEVIELSQNISLTSPIEITGKVLTINGNGHTITKDSSNWSPAGNNGTLITAGSAGTKVTLRSLKLTNSQKYGAQSYNGAYLILDDVTISNCGYGGVMVNAGTVEIMNLMLERNGSTNNNGIEIGKGSSIQTGENMPKLVMNGSLTSTEKENVVYIADNDELSEFEVENTETTTDKVFVSGDKVVVTDKQNNIKFESNTTEVDIVAEDEYVPNVTITVHLMDKTVPITVISGTVVSKENVESNINLQELGLTNYTLAGFYTDSNYTQAYDFTKPVTTDTILYAKLNPVQNTTVAEDPKDDTPKTGTQNYFEVAVLVIFSSIIGLSILQKKKF